MSTLRRQEPTGAGLKRIACAQVESAIRCLTRQAGQGVSAALAIGQARSVLALIELDLPRPTVRRERLLLTSLRDGLAELTIPTQLAGQLASKYKKNPSDTALANAVKTLRKRWATKDPSTAALSSSAGNFNPAIYRLVADMAELRGYVGDWPTDEIPSDALPRGLRRAYTRARKLAAEPVTTESIGPLTTSLVDLVNMLGLINKACPTMVKAHRKLLSRSAEELEDLQQCRALDKALRAELGKDASKAMPSSKTLNTQVMGRLGSDLTDALTETPAAFARRMHAYWNTWREQKD